MHWFAMDHYGLGSQVTLGAFIKMICKQLCIDPNVYLDSLSLYRQYLAEIPIYGIALIKTVDQNSHANSANPKDFQKRQDDQVNAQNVQDVQDDQVNAQHYVLLAQSAVSGKWCFPCGKQNYGETPLQTAWRETMEETGIDFDADGMRPFTTHEGIVHTGWSWHHKSHLSAAPMTLFAYQCETHKYNKQIPMIDKLPSIELNHTPASCVLCTNSNNLVLHQCEDTQRKGRQHKETNAIAWINLKCLNKSILSMRLRWIWNRIVKDIEMT
jgi:ADP-ribose pyrophosphatase YjhB (NUDIX family)